MVSAHLVELYQVSVLARAFRSASPVAAQPAN